MRADTKRSTSLRALRATLCVNNAKLATASSLPTLTPVNFNSCFSLGTQNDGRANGLNRRIRSSVGDNYANSEFTLSVDRVWFGNAYQVRRQSHPNDSQAAKSQFPTELYSESKYCLLSMSLECEFLRQSINGPWDCHESRLGDRLAARV
jgi:hypothetical protein